MGTCMGGEVHTGVLEARLIDIGATLEKEENDGCVAAMARDR